MFVVIVAFVFGKRECVYEIDRETVVKQNKNRLYVRIFQWGLVLVVELYILV